MSLEHSWSVHVAEDPALLTRLLTRYRERHRRYHTVEHVSTVVATVVELGARVPGSDLDAVVAAAFYHDAVYEPASPANERASARLARRDLGSVGWATPRIDHVADMIEATAHHVDPPDVDAALLFDADLAILGASPDAYDAYTANVRAEYHHLDDTAWRAGRAAFIESFLDRTTIYATAVGRDRWEAAARANLRRERAEQPG